MPTNNIMLDLQTTHEELVHQVCDVHLQWNEGQTLFGNEEVVELLNRTAPSFFARYQRLFLDDIISGISRLADPPEDRKYKNLSMFRLRDCVHATKVLTLITKYDIALAVFETNVDSLVKYRNKKLAHTDLDTFRQVVTLPSVNIGHIKAALAALSDMMNTVQEHLYQSFTGYEHVAPGQGSADYLVYCLRKGQNTIQEENADLYKDLLNHDAI